MKNLYIIACFSGHVSGTDVMWTQIDQENGASEKFYMVLIAMQFGTILGNKIPDQVFSATVSPEGEFKLCKYSLPATTGVLQHQGLMERADGAIRSR